MSDVKDEHQMTNLKAMELTPKKVAAAQDLLIKRLSLLELEDKRTKTQIPLDILVKGMMNQNLMANKANVNLDSEGHPTLYGLNPDSLYHTKTTWEEQGLREVSSDLGETAQTTRPWGGGAPNAMLLPGGVAVKLQGQNNSAPAGVTRPHHRGGDAMGLGRKEAVRLLFSDAGRSQNLDRSSGTTEVPRRDATAYGGRSSRTRDRGRDHKAAARPSQSAAARPSKHAAALVFRQGIHKMATSGQLRCTRPQPREGWGTAFTATFLTGSRRRRGLRYARHGLPRTTQSGGVFKP
jgi:hypothetical protein